MEVGETETIYPSLHCHHQNDFCINVDSDESHFNVSFIVRGKVTRHCPQTTTFEEKRQPKRIRTEVTRYEPRSPTESSLPSRCLCTELENANRPCLQSV